MYVQHMEHKLQDADFLSDMNVLVREGTPRFDPVTAYNNIKTTFIDLMPGEGLVLQNQVDTLIKLHQPTVSCWPSKTFRA